MKEIKQLIEDDDIEKAIASLDAMIASQPDCEEAYFLRGNMYRKLGNWKLAIDNYCEAKSINPKGQGALAYDAAIEVLGYYNTDLYNP